MEMDTNNEQGASINNKTVAVGSMQYAVQKLSLEPSTAYCLLHTDICFGKI